MTRMPRKSLLDDLDPQGPVDLEEEDRGKGKGKGKGKDTKKGAQDAAGKGGKGKGRTSPMAILLVIFVLGLAAAVGSFFIVSANPKAKAAMAKLPVVGRVFAPKTAKVDPTAADRQKLSQDQADLAAREAALQEAQAAAEAKAKELADKEKLLAQREAALTQLETQLQGTKNTVDKLARLWAAMKPTEAAAVAERLDDELLVSILTKMDEKQAARIMAALPPVTSARLTRIMVSHQ